MDKTTHSPYIRIYKYVYSIQMSFVFVMCICVQDSTYQEIGLIQYVRLKEHETPSDKPPLIVAINT